MRSRLLFALLLFMTLMSLLILSCSANSILQYDTEGNLSMSDPDDLGESGGDDFFDSSYDQNSYLQEFPADDLVTESGFPYSSLDTENPLAMDRLAMILVSEDTDQDWFMQKTQWSVFSNLYGLNMVLLYCDWTDEEKAATYFESVYHDLQDEEEMPVYLVGYEEGADFAAFEAAVHTERYSGLAAIGGNGLSEKRIDELKEQPGRRPLSVWIISSDLSSDVRRNIEYWKSVNAVIAGNLKTYQTLFADNLFLPPTSAADNIPTRENRMGIVLFSKAQDYYDQSVSGNIIINFISQVNEDRVCFSDGITGSDIVSIKDRHFSYNRLQTEGQQRDYWVYIPDTVITSEVPSSLILCLHGNMGTGEDMIFQSRWHETAAQNNCIIVYPYSLYKTGSQHYWQIIPEETAFIRTLVDTISGQFRVDSSRIYVTGFSNGSAMAQNLAIRCSDIFAAAVMSAPAYFEKDVYGPVDEIHEVAALYSYGTADRYLKAYNYTAEIHGVPAEHKLQYWRMLYGFDQDSYEFTKYGVYNIYSYRSLNGLPVCHWIKVDGKDHYYADEEVPQYFVFMNHYTKGSDGELYYDGNLVVSRRSIGASWDEYYEDLETSYETADTGSE